MSRTNRKLRGSARIFDADGVVIGRIPVVGQFPSPPKWAGDLIGERPHGRHQNRLCTVQCPAGQDGSGLSLFSKKYSLSCTGVGLHHGICAGWIGQ